jgi:ribosomal protein S2
METLLVLPENNEQLKAVKAILKVLQIDFISKKGKQYDEAFVKKITESRKQVKEGKISTLDTDNLWK